VRLQRRHQKVIEEAPHRYWTPNDGPRIGAAQRIPADSVATTAAGNGASGVHRLGRRPDEFVFLEMNTRLQVEPGHRAGHRMDLTEWQVRIAAGRS